MTVAEQGLPVVRLGCAYACVFLEENLIAPPGEGRSSFVQSDFHLGASGHATLCFGFQTFPQQLAGGS